MRRTLTILAATATAVAISGCVYRPTIQQGNLLQLDDIEQVQVGMTRSQVRYILGTPMVSDPFEPDRWDYVYTLQRGHDTHIDRTHFVVLFEGDKVSSVERRDLPEESAIAQRVKEERTKKAAADAKAKAAAPATPAAPSSASSPAPQPATTPAPASSPATQSPGTTPPPGG